MGCGLLYKPKQRNPLCIKGFRVNDCGPDGTPIISVFYLYPCHLPLHEVCTGC